MVLTGAQLRALFPIGVPVYLADASYAVVSDDWLTTIFYPWFWEMRTDLGLRAYTRKNDCDNFARAAAQGAQDCHALTPENPDEASKAEAVAVGEFWYTAQGGNGVTGPHAVAVRAKKIQSDLAALSFFDPQNGKEFALTKEEIFSCNFARF